jgi:hypothetical protein
MIELQLTLNGERRTAEVDPRSLLVEAVRDGFGLTRARTSRRYATRSTATSAGARAISGSSKRSRPRQLMPDLPRGLQVGDEVPPFTLLHSHQAVTESRTLFAHGPVLLHFWLFDFTGSAAGG